MAGRRLIRDANLSVQGTASATSGLTIPNNAALNPTAAVTLMCWFKVDQFNSSSNSLFDNSEAGVTNSYFFDYLQTGGFRWFSVINGVSRNITSSSARITPGTWNFVTATYTGSAVYIYLNGSKLPQEITGLSGALGTNPNQLCLMRPANASSTLPLIGKMYRPMIFNVGCTLAEHQEVFYSNGQNMSAALQAGKVLDLAMISAPSATTVTDISSTGATATIGAAGSYSTDTPFRSRNKVGSAYIRNYNFSIVPPFTAATNTAARWIDGTAGGSATDLGYGWAVLGIGGTASAQFDTSVSYSGLASLKLSTSAAASFVTSANIPAVSAANMSYAIRVLPSTAYTCTFWMKTAYTSGDSNNGASVAFVERNSSSTALVTNTSTEVKTTTDWTQYTVSFTTNASTAYLTPRPQIVGQTGTGTLIMNAWFDDIVVTGAPFNRTALGTNENRLTNTEDFTSVNWSGAGTRTADVVANPLDGTVNADQLTDVNGDTNAFQVAQALTAANFAFGQVYCASIYAKKPDGSDNNYLAFTAGVSSNRVSWDLRDGSTAFNAPSWTVSSQSLGNGWYRLYVIFPVPSGSPLLNWSTINTAAAYGYTGTGNGSVYLFGAQLTKTNYLTPYLANTTSSAVTANLRFRVSGRVAV